MTNAGSFRKGIKKQNQGKHGSPKAVIKAREAFSQLVEGNAAKLQEWLDMVAENDPKAAIELVVKVAEFVVPKLARQESVVQAEPVQLSVRWAGCDKTKMMNQRKIFPDFASASPEILQALKPDH